MFTYSGRFSTRRRASDGAAGDEGMALAIGEELDGSDGAFVAGRKRVEYVNTAKVYYMTRSNNQLTSWN